jgi:hypothetical protein
MEGVNYNGKNVLFFLSKFAHGSVSVAKLSLTSFKQCDKLHPPFRYSRWR